MTPRATADSIAPDGGTPSAAPAATPVVLIIMQGHRGPFRTIDRQLVRELRQQLAANVASRPEDTCIDLWLETPGGDAHSAYKIALLLRSYAHRLRVFVPDYAKSAGTLLTLAADEIYMAPAAELGPLDAQIGYEKEGLTISALDVARSLEDLAQASMNMALDGGLAVLDVTRLSRADSLGAMVDFATKLMQPVMDKLDPTMIHWASSLLDVSVHYARRVLSLRKSVPPAFEGADISSLPTALVERYPTHGFVISRSEARELGLPVFDLEDYERATEVVHLQEELESAHANIVRVLNDRELPEVVVAGGGGGSGQ